MINNLIAKAQNKPKDVKPYGHIAVSESDRVISIKQSFKGFVRDKEIKWPKKLGAEHPFDFQTAENVFTHVGIISGAINKIKESIVGEFSVSSDNENIDAILQDFVKNTNFTSVLREWIKEALTKGNGFIEIDAKEQKIQVLNANNMYVKRNKKGKILKYNQFMGKTINSTINNDELEEFKPNQIAHLKLNKIANGAYGIGVLYPNERVIENLILKEQDSTSLISRKAGAPIHVKVGLKGERADVGAINDFSSNLQFMTNKTEWVTDANTEMNVLNFGSIGENIENSMDRDMEKLAAGMEIPMVLFGKANIPEGIAREQRKEWQIKAASIREEIESIVVNKIFKPLLAAQSGKTKKVKGFEPQPSKGLAGDIKFQWNLPDEEEKNKRVDQLNKVIQNPFMDEALRRGAQLEIARILDLEGLDKILPKPEDAVADMEKIRKDEEEIKQPEVPGAKPTAKAKVDKLISGQKAKDYALKLLKESAKSDEVLSEGLSMEEAGNMNVREYINLTELAGFNYSDYLIKILQRLKIEKFEDLLAITDLDLELGLLSQKEINKLRIVLKDGFRKNKTIKQIENDIDSSIDIQDRFIERDGKKVLSVSAKSRPNMIARTETVRLANAGLKDLYEENDIENYQYLAAIDDRTSEICTSLNGRIFKVTDGQPGVNMPPMHANCRSTIVGVVE